MLSTAWSIVRAVSLLVVAPITAYWSRRADARMTYNEALTLHIIRAVNTSLDYRMIRRLGISQRRRNVRTYPPSDEITLPQVKGLWYGDLDASSPTILYIHGGGFCLGSAASSSTTLIRPFLDALTRLNVHAKLFSLEYDLAPENPFPGPIDQALQAYEWLLRDGHRNIAVMGESAGGNAVLSMLQRAVEKGLPMPLCALLLSPSVDLRGLSPCYDENGDFDFLSKFNPLLFLSTDTGVRKVLTEWRHFYAGTDSKQLEAASPGLHSVAGLPPMFVVYSLKELYGPEIAQFVAKAASEGVAVESLAHPYLFHVYPMLLVNHPASNEAIEALARFYAKRLTPSITE
ncbi:unnamed protein product [Aphanomyces euteiches]